MPDIDKQRCMYSLDDLKTAVKRPRDVVRELNRLYYTRLRTWEYNREAPNVFDEDWDNLLLLDACRYDAFEQASREVELPGELRANYSRGSATMEFLPANFAERDLSDTVYVTGTPMLYRMTVLDEYGRRFDHNLHAIVDVWDRIDVERLVNGNARPKQVAEATLQAAEEYPDKRLFVHFIQPHIPFIGDFGSERFGDVEGDIWRKQRDGKVGATDSELRKAYYENLLCVMPTVEALLAELRGKTVVTADHGQLIGERGFPLPMKDYGHPNGTYPSELVEVPWLSHRNGPRKRIIPEPSETEYDEEKRKELDTKAEKLLRDLGYV
jgi:hypothetical protein